MTSKEFIRKVVFYCAFAGAVHLFCSFPDPDVFHGIWKVDIIGYDLRRTAFIPLLSDLPADSELSLILHYVETYEI